MATINDSPFVDVGEGSSLATSSSYIYNIYRRNGDMGVRADVLYRSADGVDWVVDAAVTNPYTLVENATTIVATGPTTYYLTKSGSTWTAVDSGQINEATVGARYVNSMFFVFSATGVYRSADGVTWTKATPTVVPTDITYWDSKYVLLAGSRLYTTTNFSSFTSYPLSFTGYAVLSIGDTFYITSSIADLYSSTDLYNFTELLSFGVDAVGNTLVSRQMGLVEFDGVLVAVCESVNFTGTYVYASQLKILIPGVSSFEDIGVTSSGTGAASSTFCLRSVPGKHLPIVFGSFVYLPFGVFHLYRALYNSDWLTVTGTFALTEQHDSCVVLGDFNSATGIIQGTLRLDTSDGAFAARTVYLYSYTTGAKLAETTSDEGTGAWSFTQVTPGEYFVVGVAEGTDLEVPRDFDALGVITVA